MKFSRNSAKSLANQLVLAFAIVAVALTSQAGDLGEDVLKTILEMQRIISLHESNYGSQQINTAYLNHYQSEFDQARAVIERATAEKALQKYLDQPEYHKHLIQALLGMRKQLRHWSSAKFILKTTIGFDELHLTYSAEVPEFSRLADSKVAPTGTNFSLAKDVIADLTLYHGSASLNNLRDLLFSGLSTKGLHSVDKNNFVVAESFTKIGQLTRNIDPEERSHPDQILSITIKSEATVVDITAGVGKQLFEKWGPGKQGNQSGEHFGKHYGFDIVKYSYRGGTAFVVLNPAVIEKITSPLPFATVSQAAAILRETNSVAQLKKIVDRLVLEHAFSQKDVELSFRIASMSPETIDLFVNDIAGARILAKYFLAATPSANHDELFRNLLSTRDPEVFKYLALHYLSKPTLRHKRNLIEEWIHAAPIEQLSILASVLNSTEHFQSSEFSAIKDLVKIYQKNNRQSNYSCKVLFSR